MIFYQVEQTLKLCSTDREEAALLFNPAVLYFTITPEDFKRTKKKKNFNYKKQQLNYSHLS